METNTEFANNSAVAFVGGSINSANAGEFSEALAALPGEAGSAIMDVTKLEYISSAGLRVLLSLKKRCKSKPFRVVGANTAPGTFNGLYKMRSEEDDEIYNRFFRLCFGCDTVEEAEKIDPQVKWLYPLAWFRCCTSMLKGDRWGDEMRKKALGLLREKPIPLVNREERRE